MKTIVTRIKAAWAVLTSDSYFVSAYCRKSATLRSGGLYNWHFLKEVERMVENELWSDEIQSQGND